MKINEISKLEQERGFTDSESEGNFLPCNIK